VGHWEGEIPRKKWKKRKREEVLSLGDLKERLVQKEKKEACKKKKKGEGCDNQEKYKRWHSGAIDSKEAPSKQKVGVH